MRTLGIGLGLLAVAALAVVTPASAEFFGCNDNGKGKVLASYTGTAPKARSISYRAGARRHTHELSAQTTGPSITIYPRTSRPGPDSKRHCRSWLEREYRVSGTVIVPRMQCWWQ